MMKKLLVGLLAFGATVPVGGAPAAGRIVGTITTADKQPVNNGTTLIAAGCFVDLQRFAHETYYDPHMTQLSRGVFSDAVRASRQQGDLKMGGSFTFENLPPGVYNLLVETGQLANQSYSPQRIVGVVVHPGQEVNLDIVMHPGTKLEWVGEPLCNVPNGLKNAWLEGTFTTPDGKPVTCAGTLISSGVKYTLKRRSPKVSETHESDNNAGGFFSYASLRPGTYDLWVEKGFLANQFYKPMIISNVVLKPGQHTALNVVLHPGQGLERVNAPQVGRTPLHVAK